MSGTNGIIQLNWRAENDIRAGRAIKDARAVNPLIEALAQRRWSPYKEVAVEALESITGQKLGDKAEAWKAWSEKRKSDQQ